MIEALDALEPALRTRMIGVLDQKTIVARDELEARLCELLKPGSAKR